MRNLAWGRRIGLWGSRGVDYETSLGVVHCTGLYSYFVQSNGGWSGVYGARLRAM